jgi:hypothetical protein
VQKEKNTRQKRSSYLHFTHKTYMRHCHASRDRVLGRWCGTMALNTRVPIHLPPPPPQKKKPRLDGLVRSVFVSH